MTTPPYRPLLQGEPQLWSCVLRKSYVSSTKWCTDDICINSLFSASASLSGGNTTSRETDLLWNFFFSITYLGIEPGTSRHQVYSGIKPKVPPGLRFCESVSHAITWHPFFLDQLLWLFFIHSSSHHILYGSKIWDPLPETWVIQYLTPTWGETQQRMDPTAGHHSQWGQGTFQSTWQIDLLWNKSFSQQPSWNSNQGSKMQGRCSSVKPKGAPGLRPL